jgi:hypothetical protein
MRSIFLIPALALFSISAQAQPESMFVELGRCVSKDNGHLNFQIFSDSLIGTQKNVSGFLMYQPLANPRFDDEVIQVAMKVKLSLSEAKELRFKHPLLDSRNKEMILSSGKSTEYTTVSGDVYVCKMNRM